jgi:CheY-like chemotaxis protein
MGKKILLADDSITIQKVIELTFSDEDFEVVTVSNGRLAIEKVQEVRPDLVLCDIIMPEKDGYEVCDFIKKNAATSQIPVLLLTGAFEPFDQERASRVGCDGFLAKPFEPQTLIAKVKELLNQAGGRASAPRPAASPAYVPPAPAYSPPAPTPPSPSAPAHYAPAAAPASEAFVPEEPQDLYGALDSDQDESMASVTAEESATLRDAPAPPESEFGGWSPPTVELPLETRAQASVESAQEEPLFEEVFEDEPARAPEPPRTTAPIAPSPAATASYSFQASDQEDDTGTRAFRAGELPPQRPTAPVPPPPAPRAVAPPPPPAPSNPGRASSPTWSVSPSPAPPPPAPTPAPAASSFADLTPPPAAAAAAAAPTVAGGVNVPKDMVETIAQRVVAQISEKVVREIAWEVIPDLAEALIKQEIERLKAELQRT